MRADPSGTLAATWRNEADQVVGQTWGGTMCWFPRKPGRLRIERDSYTHIVRCGECPGCLEFERRRLSDRLIARYPFKATDGGLAERLAWGGTQNQERQPPSPLHLVRVYIPLAKQARLSNYLHRRSGFDLEPGFWRLGASSIAFLTRGLTPLTAWLERRGLKYRAETLKLRRGRRAWRPLTAGLLVARERYGEQVKRFYCHGLPKAERERWTVERIPYEKGYQRATSPRAWRADRVVLVPPEVWRLGRRERARVRKMLALGSTPETAAAVQALVAGFVQHASLLSNPSDHQAPRPTREQVREFYVQMARRKRRRAEGATDSPDLHTPSEGGGYVSSGSNVDGDPALEQRRKDHNEAVRRIRDRADGSITSTFERLIQAAEAREGKVMPQARAALVKLRKNLRGGK